MFQRRPDVLQQTLDVAGVHFSILGVAAPAFHGTERLSTTDLWLPGATYPIVTHLPAVRYDARRSWRVFRARRPARAGGDLAASEGRARVASRVAAR